MKCYYSPHVGKLRMHKEFRKLLKVLHCIAMEFDEELMMPGESKLRWFKRRSTRLVEKPGNQVKTFC